MNVIDKTFERASRAFFGILGVPCLYTVYSSGLDLVIKPQVIIKKEVETFDSMGMLVGYETQATFSKSEVSPVFRDVFMILHNEGSTSYQVEKLVSESNTQITMIVLELKDND